MCCEGNVDCVKKLVKFHDVQGPGKHTAKGQLESLGKPSEVLCMNPVTAVRFLTQAFRNVFYVRVGKSYVRLWHLQRS